MEYVQAKPQLTLSEEERGLLVFFVAEFPAGSFPDKQQMQEMHQAVKTSMARNVCPVQWIGIYVDTEGALLLAAPKTEQAVNNMRQSLRTVRKALQPKPDTVARTLKELCDQAESDHELELPLARPLAIADVDDDVYQARRKLITWHVVSVGIEVDWTYCRCLREERRVAFLCRRLRSKCRLCDMVDAVKTAHALAQQGSLPNCSGPRARKSEFLRRVSEALATVNPLAERDLSKLPREDQNMIRCILGGGNVYTGCLNENCLDLEERWTESKVELWDGREHFRTKRCAHCGMLASYKRKWGTQELDQALAKRTRYTGLFHHDVIPLR